MDMEEKTKVKHNKRRSTAIIFEMLVRHATSCLMEDKKDEVSKTLSIIKKFFNKGMVLAEELRAFRTLLNSHVKSSETAQKILNEVCKYSKSLSNQNIDKQKSLLIKDINHNLDFKKVYDYRIPEYRTYATVQVLFNNSRTKGNPLDNIEKLKLEEQIVGRLTQGKIEEKVDMLKVNPGYNNIIHKFAIKRFTEKYQNLLSEDQKSLLTRYAVSMLSESDKSFKSFVLGEVDKIKQKLGNIKDEEIVKDSSLMQRINESKQKLINESFDKIDDEKIIRLMQYMALAGEIK